MSHRTKLSRRELSKYLCSVPIWGAPVVTSISIPAHAQTSQSAQSVIGMWKISRVDGGSPLFMSIDPNVSEVEFLPNGAYAYNQVNWVSKEGLWSISQNGGFEWCIFTIKCNNGKVTEFENGRATKILITSGYTYISDVILERIE